jgi:hypothetical protein
LHIPDRFRSVERVFDDCSSDPLDQIHDGLAALACEDRAGWSGARCADRLVGLRALQERVDAEVVRAVADCDAVDAWQEAALGAVSWLAAKTGMLRHAATALIRTARLTRRHAQTAKALEAGDITVPHVELLAKAAHRREDLYAEHEATLLDAAATVEVQDFHTVTRRWALLADDVLSRDDVAFGFARRGFTLSPTIGGSAVSGFLDPEASATVSAALGTVQPPEGASDTRSLAQRMADGLVLLCQRSLGGKLPESRPIAGVEVTVDHDVLAGHAMANLDGLRCDIEGFGPIARVTAERLVCDCAIARVIVNGRGEILDLGRRTRLIPRALRRAVRLRDRHCQFPGCRVDAAWCDVHHVVHWLFGGETNLENCALLCRRHHVAVHEGGWKLVRGPTGLTLAA